LALAPAFRGLTVPLVKLTSARTVGEASLIRDGLRFEGIEVDLRGEHRP